MKFLASAVSAMIGFAVVGVVWVVGTRSDLLQMRDDSLDGFARVVEINYERPAFDETLTNIAVKAGLAHEAVSELAAARAKTDLVKPDEKLIEDVENFKRYDHYQLDYAAALLRLLDAVDDEPGLIKQPAFKQLKEDIEGMEFRSGNSRHDYNEFALMYNGHLQGFPGANIAAKEGLKPRPFMQEAPQPQKPAKK